MWVASGRILSLGPWTILTLHVWAALALIPVVLVHLAPRRFRLLRPPCRGPRDQPPHAPRDRRAPARRRRRVGSGERPGRDHRGRATLHRLPLASRRRRPTADDVLRRGHARHRPRVLAPARRRTRRSAARARLSGLEALGTTERDPTLDCTSGWALRTAWRGTPIRAVLDAAGADPSAPFVRVRSVTGWSVNLERGELDGALLATHVAGQAPAGRQRSAACASWLPGVAGSTGSSGSSRSRSPERATRYGIGSKRAVKCRSADGCSTIRIPGRSAARSATQRMTSMT